MESKKLFTVSAPGLGTVQVYACSKWHAIELVFDASKQPNRKLYKTGTYGKKNRLTNQKKRRNIRYNA